MIKSLKKRVFISSTYVDLIEHRKAIWELLGAFYVDISGMEKFGSQTKQPIETCLDEVRASNIFIGIIGVRYGSLDNVLKKSFSELEYLTAVENNLEILIYIIDEINSKVTPKHIDYENFERLNKFKSLLSKNHTIQKFSDPKDLAKKINNDLKRILTKEELKKNYRPKTLSGKAHVVNVDNDRWLIVIGYRFGVPYELYIAQHANSFSLINEDYDYNIIENNYKGKVRYDIQYNDEDGYSTIIEGLSRLNLGPLLSLPSLLLKYDVDLTIIKEIMKDLEYGLDDLEKKLKDKIIQLLLSEEA